MWSISTKYLLFLLRQHWFIAIYQFHVYNLIFYFSIHYSMHTTKHLVSSPHHIADPLYLFLPSLLLLPSGNHYSVLSVCVHLFILFVCPLYPTYKWNQVVFFFLHLTHFILKNTCKVHPCYCKWQISSLLWLRIFPFCVCVCVCVTSLFIHPFNYMTSKSIKVCISYGIHYFGWYLCNFPQG